MKNVHIGIFLFCLLLVSCTEESNTLYSKNYTDEQKIEIISECITLHSDIEWTEFSLFDVNMHAAAIPGPSNKHFKIVLKIDPDDCRLWTAGKEYWITSYPHGFSWVDTLLAGERLELVQSLTYMTYYKKENGTEYTLWINTDNGIVIIEYIQE